MAIMAALYVAGRFGMQVGPARIEYRSHLPDVQAARYIADVSLALLLAALFRLTQMLQAIAAGEFFSATVIARFRSFAFWLLLMAVVNFSGPLIGSVSQASAGVREFHFAIKYSEIITVGVTLVLFLLARLLERARRLDEEVREFV
jgi:hypothetical protein